MDLLLYFLRNWEINLLKSRIPLNKLGNLVFPIKFKRNDNYILIYKVKFLKVSKSFNQTTKLFIQYLNLLYAF